MLKVGLKNISILSIFKKVKEITQIMNLYFLLKFVIIYVKLFLYISAKNDNGKFKTIFRPKKKVQNNLF